MVNTAKPGVWVLTSAYNDYDQHGEYLCCIWQDKPTMEQLAEHFKYTTGQPGNVMEAMAFLSHLLNGGGRREREECWYSLRLVPFGKNVEND